MTEIKTTKIKKTKNVKNQKIITKTKTQKQLKRVNIKTVSGFE